MPRRASSVLPVAPPSRILGLVCAAVTVASTTLLVFPLREVAPVVSLGVVYLVAVLIISTVWGAWLGVLTAVASALAFRIVADRVEPRPPDERQT